MVAPDAESRRSPTPDESAGPNSGKQHDQTWREHHRLLALADDGTAALALQIGAHPAKGLASFGCVVFRSSLDPIVISETEIALPDDLWEFRASGLWADHICERPLVHWSYGLEAFGLAIDDPAELLGQAYGQRVPLGWELDFEGSPDMVAESPVGEDGEVRSYGQPGRIDGLVLFGDGKMNLTGPALRHHWWGSDEPDPDATLTGERPARSQGSSPRQSGTSMTDTKVALPLPNGVWWVTYEQHGLHSRWQAVTDQG